MIDTDGVDEVLLVCRKDTGFRRGP
jgi:hypothetical protein